MLMLSRALVLLGVAFVGYALMVERALCPLHVAAHVGDAARVRQLLLGDGDGDDGIEVDARCTYWGASGATALHEAARFGQLEVVRVLVEAGADMRATTALGESALDIAVRDREGEMEQFLRSQL